MIGVPFVFMRLPIPLEIRTKLWSGNIITAAVAVISALLIPFIYIGYKCISGKTLYFFLIYFSLTLAFGIYLVATDGGGSILDVNWFEFIGIIIFMYGNCLHSLMYGMSSQAFFVTESMLIIVILLFIADSKKRKQTDS
jgi:hypothetical protein